MMIGRMLTSVITLMFVAVPLAGAQNHQPGTMEHKPDHIEHSFADAERYAKSFDDPARDGWQMPDRVIAALGLQSGQAVADIGAGTGYFTVRLARTPGVAKVFAVDVETSMVDYVRARSAREGLKNVVAIKGAADRTNLTEPVDVVLIVDTFHHIPNRAAYFTALKQVMKPGAKLAIVDFRKDAPGDGPPNEFRFTAAQISADLGKAGFTLKSQYDFLPRQMLLIYGID